MLSWVLIKQTKKREYENTFSTVEAPPQSSLESRPFLRLSEKGEVIEDDCDDNDEINDDADDNDDDDDDNKHNGSFQT